VKAIAELATSWTAMTKTSRKNFTKAAFPVSDVPERTVGDKCVTASAHVTIRAVVWFLVLIVPALLIGHGKPVPSLLFYAVFVAVCYAVSLVRHPNRRCRTCRGSGRQRAAMFTWGDRVCTSCGGQSRHRRWGVQLFYPQSRTSAERARAEAGRRRGRLR
jgi:hypothetical protein